MVKEKDYRIGYADGYRDAKEGRQRKDKTMSGFLDNFADGLFGTLSKSKDDYQDGYVAGFREGRLQTCESNGSNGQKATG